MGDAVRTIPPGFDELSVDEQIDDVQFLWERISAHAQQVPVPAWHHEVLDERLAEFEANPDAGRPWEEVRADLLARLDQGT